MHTGRAAIVMEDQDKKTIFRRHLEYYWNMAKIPLMIWICRILAFVWTFMIHDVLSLVPLVWLLHSAMFKKLTYFANFTLYVYLPIITLEIIYYYLLNSPNVFAIIGNKNNWNNDLMFEHSRLGLFYLISPPLELFVLLICGGCLGLFARW